MRRNEMILRKRYQLGDLRAAYEIALLLTSNYEYKRSGEIIALLEEAATVGIVDSMFWLGLIYEEDWNPLKSLRMSYKWYSKAAKLGHPEACNCLALCYERGVGVRKDPASANKWFQRGAILGDRNSQFNLALNYLEGKGFKKNLKIAQHWFTAAKYQNHPEAKSKLRKIRNLTM